MAVPAADGSRSEKRKMTVSERSLPALTAALQDWLAGRSAGPGRPAVSRIGMPDNGGLSSTSVLFEATWPGEGTQRSGRYVARMAPEPSAVPVFPRYDLPVQFEVISRVAACCDIPLPRLRWNEPDGGALGTPFFWWLYMPLRFESCALIVILQENPDGYRTLNDARRVWPDGRVDQLGWPRVRISYRAGTRHPESARIYLTERDGTPLTVDLETLTSVPLHVGAGYTGDPDWSHGRWMGRGWSSSAVYDLSDPAVAGRIPFGVVDHLARARLGGEEGWGMFEHASMGRHDPTGFQDWSSLASSSP